jgi:integrase
MERAGVHREKQEGRIVIYRDWFEKLLSIPKPLRDQLVIELPTLEAFRSGEVSSLRVENVDFERGDLRVLDSKKRQLFPIPLNPVVAKHLDEYIQQEGIREGYVIRALPKAPHVGHKKDSKTLGAGLSESAIQKIWERCCLTANVPVMPPRTGRAYFATDWHFVKHKSMFHLMAILRHTNIRVTEDYLEKLVTFEDLKAEFYQGMDSPFGSDCVRAESCPVACADCHCRFYQARVEGQKVQGPAPLLRSL